MHSAGNVAETAAVRSALLELLGDVDALAERFVRQLVEIVPYSDGAVARERLLEDGVSTYERVLRRLVDLPVPERLVETSRAVGRHRAQLEVPLAAVTTGTRLHFRIVWEELAERLSPGALAAAVSLPVRLWQAVEEHSTDVQVGYHDEATALVYARDRDRRRVVEAFLDSDGDDVELASRAAAVLGAAPGDDVFCAFVPARARTGLVEESGVHLHSWHGGTVVLVPRAREERSAGRRPAVPPLLRSVACGVGPLAAGLARVPRAVRVAEQLAAALPADATGPVHLAEGAVALAVSGLGGLREEFVADALQGFVALAPHDRERVLETFDAYVATGSVAATAERTYCHRNTVLNRLRRLTESTGLDVTVPAEATVLVLAVEAWRQQA